MVDTFTIKFNHEVHARNFVNKHDGCEWASPTIQSIVDQIKEQLPPLLEVGDRVIHKYNTPSTRGTILSVYKGHCWVLRDSTDNPVTCAVDGLKKL